MATRRARKDSTTSVSHAEVRKQITDLKGQLAVLEQNHTAVRGAIAGLQALIGEKPESPDA